MGYVDLNSDLGESFGAYTIGADSDVISYITSANIACGWHAGDAMVMDRTVRTAKEAGIGIGAHPGYPDLMGFGRREMKVTPAEVKAYVQYQTGALWAFTRANGTELQHVKPHGSMYNMAGKDPKLARAICEGIASISDRLIIMALSGSEMIKAASEVGIQAASEVFADRAYEKDGSLVARSKPGSMIEDEDIMVSRVLKMVREGYVTAITGEEVAIKADSICVHGDSPRALAFVARLRESLLSEGIAVKPLRCFLQ